MECLDQKEKDKAKQITYYNLLKHLPTTMLIIMNNSYKYVKLKNEGLNLNIRMRK